jgi:hypothetical protein
MVSLETARAISENLPSWLAILSLSVPALGAVIVKLKNPPDVFLKFLEINSITEGRGYPDGRPYTQLKMKDNSTVIVPSGGKGTITIKKIGDESKQKLVLSVSDFRRREPVNSNPGHANVYLGSDPFAGSPNDLRKIDEEVEIDPGIFVTYVQNSSEAKLE